MLVNVGVGKEKVIISDEQENWWILLQACQTLNTVVKVDEDGQGTALLWRPPDWAQ